MKRRRGALLFIFVLAALVAGAANPLLAQNPTLVCGQPAGGVLNSKDQDFFGDGTFTDLYDFTLTKPAIVTLSMAFDQATASEAYVQINNSQGQRVVGGVSPRVTVLPVGTYTVIANNFTVLPPGDYPYTIQADCQARDEINCGDTLNAALEDGDVDFFNDGTRADLYAFTLTDPTLVEISMDAGGGFNPYLELREATTNTVYFVGLTGQISGLLLPGNYTLVANNFNVVPYPAPYVLTMVCDSFTTSPLIGATHCGDQVSGTLEVSDISFYVNNDPSTNGYTDFYSITLDESTFLGTLVTPPPASGQTPFIRVFSDDFLFYFPSLDSNPSSGVAASSGVLLPGTYLISVSFLTAQKDPYDYTLQVDCASSTYFSEYFEDPNDVTLDDNDGKTPHALKVNHDGLPHPTERLDGSTPEAVIDGVRADGSSDERIVRGLSGMAWGGYCASGAVHGPTHNLEILNIEDVFNPIPNPPLTDPPVKQYMRNSFLTFGQHNALKAGDFGAYDEKTGSYVYTIFSSENRPDQSSLKPGVELTEGLLKVALSSDQSAEHVDRYQSFRFLIQTDSGNWYRSNELFAPNVQMIDGIFGDSNSNILTRKQRADQILTPFRVASMTWQRVSAAAETNMNQLGDGGEVPLGDAQTGDPGPNLKNVTGVGVLIDQLTDGLNIGGIPNSVALLGLSVEIFPDLRNNVCQRLADADNIENNLKLTDNIYFGGDSPTHRGGFSFFVYEPPLVDTSVAGASADDPVPTCVNGCPLGHTVWYRFTAPENGTISLNTFGSQYDTVMAVYTGQCGRFDAELACNDDFISGLNLTRDSFIPTVRVTSGETIYILVGSYSAANSQGVCQASDGGLLDFNFSWFPDSLGVQFTDCGQTAAGQLAPGDFNLFGDGTFSDIYKITLGADTSVTLTLTPGATYFDRLLLVIDRDGSIVAGDVLTGQTSTDCVPDSLCADLPAGEYFIIVNNLVPGVPGETLDYTLAVGCQLLFSTIDCGGSADGTLTDSDSDLFGDGTRADIYLFTVTATEQVTATMTTTNPSLQPYVGFFNLDLTQNLGDGLGSATVTLDPGQYYIIANNFSVLPPGAYPYTLSVDCSTPGTGLAVLKDLSFETGALAGWTGGRLSGGGSAYLDGGLCMSVPAGGDNVVGWVGPENDIQLSDMSAYRVRLSMTTDQTAPNAIPLWRFMYDNYSSSGNGNTYGGQQWFLDVDGGANGIGRPNGRSNFEVWIAPAGMESPAWRGLVDPDNSAFSPAADPYNDLRIGVHLLDYGSGGYAANADSGTICVKSVEVTRVPLSSLGTPELVYGGPIHAATHAAQTYDQAALGLGQASIDDAAGEALYQLATPEDRKTLIPAVAPFDAAGLYPVVWESDTLYMGVVRLRSAVAGPAEGTDPVDAVFVNFDTANSELGVMGYVTRGSVGNMHFAGSPRLLSTTGAAQPYVAFFHSNNATASLDPGAGRLRAMGDFFNSETLGRDGTGVDPFAVQSLEVYKVRMP